MKEAEACPICAAIAYGPSPDRVAMMAHLFGFAVGVDPNGEYGDTMCERHREQSGEPPTDEERAISRALLGQGSES